MIPNAVKNFLAALRLNAAQEVIEWLDGDPDAVDKMIEELIQAHPALVDLCGISVTDLNPANHRRKR